MSNFPGAVDVFTVKVPHVSPNAAADVNGLQDSVVAIETALKTAPNPNTLDFVSKSRSDTLTGRPTFNGGAVFAAGQVVTHGSGDILTGITNHAVTGSLLDIRSGTAAVPDQLAQPVLTAYRQMSMPGALLASGNGNDEAPVIRAIGHALATSQVQSVGIFGMGITDSSSSGAFGGGGQSLNADANGGVFIGISQGTSTRFGIGAYIDGRANGAGSRCTGLEVASRNFSGTDHTVNANGIGSSDAIWIHASGSAPPLLGRSSAGINFGNINGTQFDVGIHFNGQTGATRVDAACTTTLGSATVLDAAILATDFNKTVTGAGIPTNAVITSVNPGVSFTLSALATASGGPVALTLGFQGPAYTAAIQDDSDALYGIYITANANHQQGAIVVARGGGAVVIGGLTPQNINSLLDIAPAGVTFANVSAAGFIPIRRGILTVGLTGTYSSQFFELLKAPVIDGGGVANTVTSAATFVIEGAPSAANAAVITNAYSLWVEAGISRFDGNLSLPNVDVVLGTAAGTKLGTANTQKLGLWGKTPVVQPAAYTVTNPTANRSLDVTGATLAQLAQVVGTLIADIQSWGGVG